MSSDLLKEDGLAAPSYALAGNQESAEEIYRLIRDEIAPHLSELACCRSTKELGRNRVYRRLEPVLRTVLETPEWGDLGWNGVAPRSAYRFVPGTSSAASNLTGRSRPSVPIPTSGRPTLCS